MPSGCWRSQELGGTTSSSWGRAWLDLWHANEILASPGSCLTRTKPSNHGWSSWSKTGISLRKLFTVFTGRECSLGRCSRYGTPSRLGPAFFRINPGNMGATLEPRGSHQKSTRARFRTMWFLDGR